MGNGGPGSMEYSATTGRLGLGLLGLEGEALGSGALLLKIMAKVDTSPSLASSKKRQNVT